MAQRIPVLDASSPLTTQIATCDTPAGNGAQTPREQRLVLRLRPRGRPRVTWQEDTVDNEMLQKKSSKKCCVFHKQKAFDESSSDEEGEGEGEGRHNHGPGDGDGCCPHSAQGSGASEATRPCS